MGGNFYNRQIPVALITGATLSADYADNRQTFNVAGMAKLSLDINYTRGAGEASSKLQFILEHSEDGSDWHRLVIDETSTVSTITPRVWELTNTGKVNVLIDIAYKFMRLSVAEAGAVTNDGTVTIKGLISGS